MLWAAFTICFFGFIRSGEICSGADGPFNPTSDLTPQDIEIDSIENPQIFRVRLKHSKPDPFREGSPSDIFVSRTQNELCSVSAVLAWLTIKEADWTTHLQSGAPLTRSAFLTRFKEALTTAGIEATRFSGHSYRRGAATTKQEVV